MIFASIDPRVFTTDPTPWQSFDMHNDVGRTAQFDPEAETSLFHPDPATIPRTAHPHNLLLVAARMSVDDGAGTHQTRGGSSRRDNLQSFLNELEQYNPDLILTDSPEWDLIDTVHHNLTRHYGARPEPWGHDPLAAPFNEQRAHARAVLRRVLTMKETTA
ncbi:hypothetical protein [Leifsonia sp. Leaf264]|uniref:hypothetical protein n=1 Tax=Leifsonia sp. Leaf264 TaxID=1736314 RepID=UPI0006FA5B40|nr:hypothetical protein [Leifsonia sp. Leaf264]KQO98344.1 hypothetical protein ASF30_09800 [Leifsonia sp. Leaf264]